MQTPPAECLRSTPCKRARQVQVRHASSKSVLQGRHFLRKAVSKLVFKSVPKGCVRRISIKSTSLTVFFKSAVRECLRRARNVALQ